MAAAFPCSPSRGPARAALAAAALLGGLLGGCGPRIAAPPRGEARHDDGGIDVHLTTRDGVRLVATDWPGTAAEDRCVVLVHQETSSRQEWEPMIERLRGRYELLALDLRGHGDSIRGLAGPLSWRDLDAAGWRAAARDLDAARAWLAERGYRTADCVYVGAGLGATLVAGFAARHVDTAGIVLLSPALEARGVTLDAAVARYRGPVMMIGNDAPEEQRAVAALDGWWGGRAAIVETAGPSRGVAIVADHPAFVDAIAAFVRDAFAAVAKD